MKKKTLVVFAEQKKSFCFPSIYTILGKKSIFWEKGGKNGGKQTNSKNFLENSHNENFCLTYFSKLNRDHIEKKLYRFEDNTASKEGGPCRKSRKSDTTICWVLTCQTASWPIWFTRADLHDLKFQFFLQNLCCLGHCLTF